MYARHDLADDPQREGVQHPAQREARHGRSTSRLRRFEPEADLEHHLELGDLAVLDEPSLIHDLEPIEVAQRLCRLGDGVFRRLRIALVGNAAKLDDLERLLWHGFLLVDAECRPATGRWLQKTQIAQRSSDGFAMAVFSRAGGKSVRGLRF